jgi:TolB-like protein/Tfp pilus assembly protein PilF
MTTANKAVFLSYASDDSAAAQRICDALRAAGVEVWFDLNELRGGDAWDHKIREQVKECALFIPIISANTQARPEGYFRLEWDVADHRSHMIGRGKAFIVPVCIDKTPDRGADVPDSFFKVQWTRLPGGETPQAFCQHIAALLGAAPAVRAAPPPPMHSATAQNRRTPRWIWPAVAVVAAVLIAGAAWRWKSSTQAAAQPAPAVVATAASAVPEKSIAVLPFVDMSEKHDQEFFSDGLSEELIDHLAHSTDLKVIARTSSFAFKGKNEDMRTIASKLGVANLLEGSVRKAGRELRVTAQLIRASDGVHLWSEIYDRQLSDIFKVQDEIATTVANALKAELTKETHPATAGTANVDTYNLILQGNYFFGRANQGDLERAVSSFQQAIKREPRNAVAWARLGRVYVWRGLQGEITSSEARPKALDAVQQALAINPSLAEAHYALGNLHAYLDQDKESAILEYKRAIALDPQSQIADYARINTAVAAANQSGNFDDALRLFEQAHVRDPLEPLNVANLGQFSFFAGRLEQAASYYQQLLDLDAGFLGAHAQYGRVLLAMGKPAEALTITSQEPDEGSKLTVLTCIFWATNRRAESDAALRTLETKYGGKYFYSVAQAHICRGESAVALDWLERARQQHDGSLIVVRTDPAFRSLHGDARFRALLRALKLPET